MHHYQVSSIIGQGAYGVVLKAKRKQNGEVVAIKKFKETEDDQLIKKTISRELNVLKSLKHENIVQLNQAFKNKGLVCLVFQFLDNNLLEVLEKNKKGLQKQEIVKYIFQVLKGLEYMHSLGYVHRDIKPENLLVSSKGTLKICDMGFARFLSPNMTDYVATRWYRPPELLIGDEYGPPIDIWALGCIMAELSDTQPLFPGDNEIDQLKRIVSVFGPLPLNLSKLIKGHRTFKKFNWGKGNKESFKQKYKKTLSSVGLDLLQKMLQIDPKSRITAKEALQHPYFDSLKIKSPTTHRQFSLFPNEEKQLNYTERKLKNLTNNPCSNHNKHFSQVNSLLSLQNVMKQKFYHKKKQNQPLQCKKKPTICLEQIYRDKNIGKQKIMSRVSEKEKRKLSESTKYWHMKGQIKSILNNNAKKIHQ